MSPTYAVTLYLRDAVPKHTRERWRQERKQRIEALLKRGEALDATKITDMMKHQHEAVHLILQRNHGSCIFGGNREALLASEELRRFDGILYRLYAWCIMPNHVRIVIQPLCDAALPELVSQWKIRTARRVNKLRRRKGSIWNTEQSDCIIECAEELLKHIEGTWAAPDATGLRHWIWRWRIDRAFALETIAQGAARTRSCLSSATRPTCTRP